MAVLQWYLQRSTSGCSGDGTGNCKLVFLLLLLLLLLILILLVLVLLAVVVVVVVMKALIITQVHKYTIRGLLWGLSLLFIA